ncbi:MAG: nuclear transport factor 2 family protein [Chloroflexi bacterium]|nr:nuclear transport factor 2 family protein [Chloroflexota bacterium]
MTDNSPKAVALRSFDLYNDGTPESYGTDRFLEVWAEDAVMEFRPSAQFPHGMMHSGKAEIRKNHADVSRVWRNRRCIMHDLVSDGDRVVILHTWSAVAAVDLPSVPAGATLSLDCADFYTVKDGLITRMAELVGPPQVGKP